MPTKHQALPQNPLLELTGRVAGAPVKVRVLEPQGCNRDALYEQIVAGCYERPFIIDDGETRQLWLGLDLVQSSMRLDDPYALDFAYTRKMMAFLLFAPEPEHVLMVGLGGGSLAKFCHRHLPRTRMTVVEVSEDVIAMRGEFAVPDDDRIAIVQADAAAYLPAAEADTDVLLLDGFDASGIAPTFLNRSFYQAARRRLRAGGVLVANLAGPKACWGDHYTMLKRVFEGRVHLACVTGGDNHIAFAFADEGFPPDWRRLEDRAETLGARLPLDFPALVSRLRQ
jgi:spermidine synthase